ncbi:hypothetical protein [Auritidibacter ignavus]|uniref:hypothetical protein n=1 Tax=Auritidibacter ignavus TaxID=678932 RepID=UPI002FE66AEB
MRTVKSSWRLVALTPLCLASLVAPLTLTTLPATSAPAETPGATQQPSTPSGEPHLQPGTRSPTTELVDDSASPTEQSSPNEPSSPTSEQSSREPTESSSADPDDKITCQSTSTTKAPVTITFTGLAKGDEISQAPPTITGTVRITEPRVVYWPKRGDLRQEELNLKVTRDDEVITTCSVTVGPFDPSDSQSPSATSPPSPSQDPSPTSSPGPGTRPSDSGGQQPDAPNTPRPGQPDQPEEPAQPEQPPQPGEPHQPGQPQQPGGPPQPGAEQPDGSGGARDTGGGEPDIKQTPSPEDVPEGRGYVASGPTGVIHDAFGLGSDQGAALRRPPQGAYIEPSEQRSTAPAMSWDEIENSVEEREQKQLNEQAEQSEETVPLTRQNSQTWVWIVLTLGLLVVASTVVYFVIASRHRDHGPGNETQAT